MGTILQDLRFALRQLRKSPGFTFTAVAIFALGIGASTAIFAFVDAALVKPLPYRDPSRLMALYERIPVGDRYHLSYGDYLDWKHLNRSFTSLDVYMPDSLCLENGSSHGGSIRSPCERRIFPHAWGFPAPRPRLHARRRSAKRPTNGAAELRGMAEAVRGEQDVCWAKRSRWTVFP